MTATTPDKPSTTTLSRRHVFVGAGTAGALAAVAGLLPQAAPEAVAVVTQAAAPEQVGYRLSEHVQRYYQTARV